MSAKFVLYIGLSFVQSIIETESSFRLELSFAAFLGNRTLDLVEHIDKF